MFGLSRNERRRRWITAVAFVFFCVKATGQPYIPGQTYFGRSNYMEYAAGDLPFILSAPHGGGLTPSELRDRTNCVSCPGWDFETATDSNTADVVDKVRIEVGKLTGHLPHVIICNLQRAKIDCNRGPAEGAQNDPETIIAYNEFRSFINSASNNVITNFGKGFYIDQHGQSHPENRLELGYLLDKYDLTNTDNTLDATSAYKNSSSIRTLANSVSNVTSFSKLLRGTNSVGALMVDEGYPATPSDATPYPFASPSTNNSFFDGGYNTALYGSDNGGPLSALQIEANYTGVRDTSANRTNYARALARVVEKYFTLHYGINLRACAPSVWDSAGGNWSTAGNWALGIVPVSSNLLVFAGAGGAVTHNLAALATGTGVVTSLTFSNAPTGSYSISGNAFSILEGITNNSDVPQTINNHLTLITTQSFVSTSGTLVLGGNVTNGGNQLRCLGNLAANGIISGNGGLTRLGSGTLALTAVNTYSGPTTNSSGVISVNGTSSFGDGNGLLVLAGGDVLCKNTRSSAPITNPLLLAGSSTILGDGTLTNSLRILPFSANSLTTASGSLTLRHSGTNAYASNNVFRVRFTGSGFSFTRPITLGFIGDLSSTQTELESYNASGDEIFSGNISGIGVFRRDAASAAAAGRTILSGVNSYSGGTIVAAGTLLVNNPFGSGTGSGFVAVSNTGALGGSGTISGPVICAGVVSAGQSAGTLTFDGGLDLSVGGTNIWELAALSETGEGVSFDQFVLAGGNLALGGSAKLQLSFIGLASLPATTNSFWQGIRSWKIISLTGAATNTGATHFPTILNGGFAAGAFTNYADANGNVWLKFIPTNAYTPPVIEATVLNAGTTNTTLSWSAVVGQTYEIRCKDDLDGGPWALLAAVTATNNPTTFVDTSGHQPQRFYRVIIP